MDGQTDYSIFEMHTPESEPTLTPEPVEQPSRLLLEIEETAERGAVFAETDVVSGYTLRCGRL